MNIKSSDSASKNKLFLGFWFVLFAMLILMINWLFGLPVNRSESLLNKLADTDKQITRLTSLHAKFLLSNDKEDNLFVLSNDRTEREIRQSVMKLKENIASFKNIRRLKRNKEIAASLDELSVTTDGFEANLNNLMMITHERGSKNSGLVLRWMETSKKLLSASARTDETTVQKLNQIKQLESDYLLFRNIKTLQEISILTEEIRNQITSEEGGIDLNDVDSYMVLTGNLVSVEKRLGHTSTQGIIPELESALQKFPALFSNLDLMITEQFSRTKVIWTIARYMALLFLVSLFIYLFIKVFSLVDPLQKIAGFSRSLASGQLPEDNMVAGNLMDMKVIKDSLGKHVASLRHKFNFIKMMNQDVLDSKLELAGEKDMLGNELILLQQKILKNVEIQAKNEEDNLVRRYMNEGLAKFADILRSKNNDISMLGDHFIREIVKYLNAIQGGFFVYDDSEKSAPILKLISAFAYNRKKYLQQSIAFGEGLVGTCAKERKYINLTDIPKGYISITSGLGDTTPDNLLLVPVLHENDLLGVIEIASLHKFKQHEIDFAQEVAQSLGSTMVNTRNNQRTEDLLAKSQQQAQEMAEQEEEMRQNMEELKATQEESTRREEELSGFVNAISTAMLVIEYDTEGKILEVNDRLCLFLGRERDEILGRTHYELFEGSFNPDVQFWNKLQLDGHCIISENIRIGKKTFAITEHFAPVLNRGSETVKYINLATDGRIGNS